MRYAVTLTNSREEKLAEVEETTRRNGLSKEELFGILSRCGLNRIVWGDADYLEEEYAQISDNSADRV